MMLPVAAVSGGTLMLWHPLLRGSAVRLRLVRVRSVRSTSALEASLNPNFSQDVSSEGRVESWLSMHSRILLGSHYKCSR
jgi:hypothetical protein